MSGHGLHTPCKAASKWSHLVSRQLSLDLFVARDENQRVLPRRNSAPRALPIVTKAPPSNQAEEGADTLTGCTSGTGSFSSAESGSPASGGFGTTWLRVVCWSRSATLWSSQVSVDSTRCRAVRSQQTRQAVEQSDLSKLQKHYSCFGPRIGCFRLISPFRNRPLQP